MVEVRNGYKKIALVGVGQAVPAVEIAKFADNLKRVGGNKLQSRLAEAQEIAKEIYGGYPGFNLVKDISNPESRSYKTTAFIQPLTLVLCAEAKRLAKFQHNGEPLKTVIITGHSLGFVWAAYEGGVMPDYISFIKFGTTRGLVMREAGQATNSTLSSILGTTEDRILKALELHPHIHIALENSPNHFVLGHTKNRSGEVEEVAKAAGAKKVICHDTEGGFHVEEFMSDARRKMEDHIKKEGLKFKNVKEGVVILANSSGLPLTQAKDVEYELLHSIVNRVRYPRVVENMRGIDILIEVGGGKVIKALNNSNGIQRDITHHIEDYLPKSA